jgi:glycosyltransferase involved in cell wall biosynthesis
MNPPYVSVIVPCLNRKEWLQAAIASLRAQSYPANSFEIIVVDNGSQDGAWEWLQETSKQVGVSLKCFRNDTPHKTPTGSRNVGIRYARGEIIGFTDSDCTVTHDWIEKAVARFRGPMGIVVGKTIPLSNDPVGPLSRIKVIEGEEFFDACNIFYSRDAINRTGGFDTYVAGLSFAVAGEDSELGLRVKNAGYQSVFAEDVVVMHRIRSQGLWQWLIEPRTLLSVPYVVKKNPIARKRYLFLRYFLSPLTALFDLLLLGLGLAWWINPWFALLGVPFLVGKMIEGRAGLGLAMGIVRVIGGSVRAGIIFLVLFFASIRYRCLVI